MRLYFNLFGWPIACGVISLILFNASTQFEGRQFIGQFAIYLDYAALAAGVVAAVWLLANYGILWRAGQGKGEICYSCGHPTTYKPNGRYGPYFKCWSCGTNRADR